MELRDYATVLRRYWATWLGTTLAGLLIAFAFVHFAPQTYQANAQVFIASSGEGTSGSQFVSQRVKSYPDIAVSEAVLGPVLRRLDLNESVAELRAQVTAVNPVDTSQIDIAVTSASPGRASDIANAVATQFSVVVKQLETPSQGASPVTLTVTNPATVPSAPISPVPSLAFALGLVVGLVSGVATAVVRSRMDTAVYSEGDLRRAWNGYANALGGIPVIAPSTSRRVRRRTPGSGTAAALARRLEVMAEPGPVQLAILPAAAEADRPLQTFASDVREQLSSRGLGTEMGRAPREARTAGAGTRAPVRLDVGDPQASLRDLRRIAAEYDGVVVVVESGRADRAEVDELSTTLSVAGITPLAVVLARTQRNRRRSPAAAAAPVQLPERVTAMRSLGTADRSVTR